MLLGELAKLYLLNSYFLKSNFWVYVLRRTGSEFLFIFFDSENERLLAARKLGLDCRFEKEARMHRAVPRGYAPGQPRAATAPPTALRVLRDLPQSVSFAGSFRA